MYVGREIVKGKKSIYLSMTVVCLFLGIILTVQFKTNQQAQNDLSRQPVEDLVTIAKSLNEERQRLEDELVSLRKQQQEYETMAMDGTQSRDNMEKELQRLKTATGLVDIKGPGVMIEIEESPALQNYDIITILNELWAAGAEGIAINGERWAINSSIEFREGSRNLWINNKPIASPYKIIAIGDAQTLETALKMPGGVSEQLVTLQINLLITIKDELEISSYKGSYMFKQAHQMEEGANA